MASQVVLFAEEDNMFRLMETALNGVASSQAERALHYFFGESIDEPLKRLTELPSILGLPPGIRGIICDDEAKLADYIREADYLVAESAKVTRDLIRLGQGRLRLIHKFGWDYRNIDLDAAREFGIPTANLMRVSTISVAEHFVLLILAVARKLTDAHAAALARAGCHDGSKSEGPPRTSFNWGRIQNIQVISGKTLGMVGLGENGMEVAQRAYCLGMKIGYYQRHRLPEKLEGSVGAVYHRSLADLMKVSDFVSINVPYNRSTEKLINAEALAAMKKGAYLINASRGGVVDEGALFNALKGGKIAGAALDVYRWEPIPPDCPLLKLDNVVWSTHNAAGSPHFMVEESRAVLENIARVAKGMEPAGRVA
ncbi:MAG: NAD(P)-dependent oxidoreductase, partial [Candidatus Binatia bacterium]